MARGTGGKGPLELENMGEIAERREPIEEECPVFETSTNLGLPSKMHMCRTGPEKWQ